MILPIFMFSRSGNSIMTLPEFYHHRVTSKIQFKPEVLELRGYPSFSLVEFSRSTGGGRILKVSPLNSPTSKT